MVSIIILSYNTKELLSKCLKSIFSYVQEDTEVIVVDNASTDGSIQMLQKDFKKIILIKNKKNVGFSRGCNIGAKNAKGKYLLFLNSDIQFKNNAVKLLSSAMSEYKHAAVVGGFLKNKDGSLQRSGGSFYSLRQVFIMLFMGEKFERLQIKTDTIQEVDWVSGGCMLVRKDVFEKLGGFDENFFMYVEDMELCFRIKKSGYKVYMHPDTKIDHVSQGSSDRAFAIHHIYKGLLYFYKKHKSSKQTRTLLFLLKIKAYCAIIVGILTGNHSLRTTYIGALQGL